MQPGVQQRKVNDVQAPTADRHASTSTAGAVTAPGGGESACVPVEGASALALMIGHKQYSELTARGGIRGLLQSLNTDDKNGIAAASIPTRITRYGSNKLPEEELRSFNEYVKETLDDRTMKILIGAAVASLVLGMTTPDPRTGEVDRATGWIEGAAILVSVAIVTVVSAVNNYQKQLQFRALSNAETTAPVAVIRDGKVVEVANDDVVVGDIALVMAGMALTCDMVLVDGTGYSTNEASITGETDDVHKAVDGDPFLVSGTFIVDGCDGIAVVVAVGPQSFSGSISMATRQEKKDTPLQEQLGEMADIIGKFGLGAAIFTFVVLLIKELVVIFFFGGRFYAMKFFENLTTAVAIVVVAVPEGLPLSVTLSLAYSMKQMLADKNLVRHLAACETMGGATCICTDKTGTLTNNDMRAVAFFIDDERISVPAAEAPVAIDAQNLSQARAALLAKLADCVAFNYPSTFANKTALALQQLCRQLVPVSGYDATKVVASVEKERVQRFAFSSLRKRSSVVVQGPANGGATLTHYVIGAAELVFQKCTGNFVDGRRVPLSPESKARYERAIDDFSRAGYRTLCIAMSERAAHDGMTLPSSPPEDPLTIVAVVAIEEPLRPEVPNAIAACQGAGIRVRMITGDSVATAANIALRCGILQSERAAEEKFAVMDGAAFRGLADDDIFKDVLPRLCVLARATPLDKKRLVTLIQKADADAVVAVTGDGTNDAPALKSAAVGFAMNSGSDIAKQASDIVLMDDNFVGVVKAVVWGRNVRDNIRKFLQFQLTVNAVACIVAFLGAVMNSQNLSPLKPVQLLWLNLIMDTFAALALATELPNEAVLLKRMPDPRSSSIITKDMVHTIVGQAAFQLVTELVILGIGHDLMGVPYFGDVHLTMAFNTFVLLQVFNFFNARLLQWDARLTSNLNKSHVMLYIVFLIFVLQVVIVQKGGKFMSTVPLTGRQWMQCLGIASISLPVGAALRRAMVRNRTAGSSQLQGRVHSMLARVVNRMDSTGSKREDKR